MNDEVADEELSIVNEEMFNVQFWMFKLKGKRGVFEAKS